MQVQNPTVPRRKATLRHQTPIIVKNSWHPVMQALHGGLAWALLVLQAQRDYFACIGRMMRTETNRGLCHGRL
jgi:hypothetical protein